MRDPQSVTSFEAKLVRRRLLEPLDDGHCLRSELAQRWVAAGQLTAYEMVSPTELVSPRLPFVSHPYEWSDTQVHAAAQLTLSLQSEAIEQGYALKDASAWNVIFEGTRPVFCDLMSFVALTDRHWWAAGQFGRHFLLPLLLSRRRQFAAGQAFLVWRDGVPPQQARAMLGAGWWWGRCWPLMLRGSEAAAAKAQPGAAPGDARQHAAHQRNLLSGLGWMLQSLAPANRGQGAMRSFWSRYTVERDHYVGDSLSLKRSMVSGWLTALAPACVLDLGANDGEFSELAAATGSRVIAVDSDHGAIDQLCRRLGPQHKITPVVASLDDLGGGRGWYGHEFPGLLERLRGTSDLVMMLALIHHLTIAAAVRLEDVVDFTVKLSSRFLIIEWIGPGDPQLRLLCQQRQRFGEDWTISRQRQAFESAGWRLRESVDLRPADRMLALLERV